MSNADSLIRKANLRKRDHFLIRLDNAAHTQIVCVKTYLYMHGNYDVGQVEACNLAALAIARQVIKTSPRRVIGLVCLEKGVLVYKKYRCFCFRHPAPGA